MRAPRRATMVIAASVTALLVSYVWFTQRVVSTLRAEAGREGRMYAQVYRALNDTSSDAIGALFSLAEHIRESGVPVILTDADGKPTDAANLPFDFHPDDPRLTEWIARLDLENEPVRESGVGTVHYGHTPLVRELRVVPLLQAGVLALVLIAGVYIFRTRANADRERVWAGMARESAHQLGTPLSSLTGWIELLRERDENDGLTIRALDHMQGDLERLERVAHRFERIGRPPRKEVVDVGAVVTRVADYFRARVPSLAHAVAIETTLDEELTIDGDAVLVEWGLEALIKNAIDALAGNGGHVRIVAERLPEAVRLVVSDDGPGIPRELRTRVFDAGFSTKQHGWGLGLALTRRIVEESHGGKLTLLPTDRGAAFQIIIPA